MDTARLKALCKLSPFATGPSAITELHAGGAFFCVVYRRQLVFHPDLRVDLNYQVLDDLQPLDDEAETLAAESCSGQLIENARNYLEISFPSMTFMGSECENLHGHLAFHVFGTVKHEVDLEKLLGRDVSDMPGQLSDSVVFISEHGI